MVEAFPEKNARPRAARPRVVLLQLGGLPALWLRRWLTERRFLPDQAPAPRDLVAAGGLARLARGVFATLVPVDPTLTAPNMVTMATGALPATHGVISNRFFRRGRRVLGFAEPVQAETLWQAALRQGRRVLTWIAVGAPCTTPLPAGQRAACYATRRLVGPSRQVVVLTHPVTAGSTVRGGHLVIDAGDRTPGRRRIELSVTMDRQGVVALRLPRGVEVAGGKAAELRPGETRRLLWSGGRTLAGEIAPRRQTVVRLQSIDHRRSTVTLFAGRTAINLARPSSFRLALDRAGVIRPGPAAVQAFNKGLIDEHGFVDSAIREMETLVGLARLVGPGDTFDLAVLYLAAVESMARALWAPLGRAELAPEEVRRFHGALEQGLRRVDRLLARLLDALDPRRTRILAASDHGLLSVHTDVSLKAALGPISPDIRTVASGSAGFIHLPPGVDLSRVIRRLRALKIGGRQVFRPGRITPRRELATRGLPPGAADLFVQAAPGFTLSDRRSRRLTSWPRAMARGGPSSDQAGLHAVFLATGPGLRPLELPALRIAQVAAMVAEALGMTPPRQADPACPSLWKDSSAQSSRNR